LPTFKIHQRLDYALMATSTCLLEQLFLERLLLELVGATVFVGVIVA
jgi:hypothetical protein